MLTAGLAALTVTAAVAAYVHVHPGPNALDRFGFTLLAPSTNSSFFRGVTWLGTVAALVLGSLSAAAIAWFGQRQLRGRAVACLVGPAAAAAVNEFLMKPVVNRLYVGELSFASGSVVVIAGVSTAWVLAVPRKFKPPTVLLGSLVVLMMIVAVVVLRWHYPSDAIIGVPFAAGMVFLVEGAASILPKRPSGGTGPGSGRHPASLIARVPSARG
jgi:hypothetical protein